MEATHEDYEDYQKIGAVIAHVINFNISQVSICLKVYHHLDFRKLLLVNKYAYDHLQLHKVCDEVNAGDVYRGEEVTSIFLTSPASNKGNSCSDLSYRPN